MLKTANPIQSANFFFMIPVLNIDLEIEDLRQPGHFGRHYEKYACRAHDLNRILRASEDFLADDR